MNNQEAFEKWQEYTSLEEMHSPWAAWQAALEWVAKEQKPVARLLNWKGPKHIPVPHGGIAARTFEEFPLNTQERYWFEGEPLYLRQAPIPEGWKLVPIEPTEEMVEAAIDRADGVRNGYRAMLAAAPEYKELK